jgi:hypothetical protein
MKNFRRGFCALLFVIVGLTVTSLTHGQASRTWVSGIGDDINPCSRTSPCKTFAGAISKTTVGGEIDALDPAGFGAVSITKSITIDGSGTLASILGDGTNGVIINIKATTDTAKSVRLRGLSINGAGKGLNGVNIYAANKVSIENCVIDGFQNGVSIAGGTAFIRNSTIRNNAAAGISTEGGATVGVSESALIFNSAPTAGAPASFAWFSGVVSFGNSTGDPARDPKAKQ